MTLEDVLRLAEVRRKCASGEARALRLAADLRQREIGDHCGVSSDTVGEWEMARCVPRGRPGVALLPAAGCAGATDGGRLLIPDPREQPTLSVPEAGELLGLGRSASYLAAERGEIPTLHFGRTVRVPTARLRVLLGIDSEPVVDSPAAEVVPMRRGAEG